MKASFTSGQSIGKKKNEGAKYSDHYAENLARVLSLIDKDFGLSEIKKLVTPPPFKKPLVFSKIIIHTPICSVIEPRTGPIGKKKPKFNSYLHSAAIITSMTLFGSQSFAATYPEYKIKKGDVLSLISRKFFGAPIYGKRGSLSKILALNHHIKNPDLIYPGQKVSFEEPSDAAPPLANEAKTSRALASESSLEQVEADEVGTDLSPGMEIAAIPHKRPKRSLSAFDLSSIFDYSALQGTSISNGTRGNLISSLNIGLKLEWIQLWTPELETSFFITGKKLSFLDDSRGTLIYNRNLNLFSFGGIARKDLSSRLSVNAELELAQTVFYEGHPSDSGLQINPLPIMRLHPGVTYQFLKVEGLELKGETGASLYAPSSYDQYTVNLGYGYDLGLKVTHKTSAKNIIHCKLFYSTRKQNTSLLTISEPLAGLECGLTFGGIR